MKLFTTISALCVLAANGHPLGKQEEQAIEPGFKPFDSQGKGLHAVPAPIPVAAEIPANPASFSLPSLGVQVSWRAPPPQPPKAPTPPAVTLPKPVKIEPSVSSAKQGPGDKPPATKPAQAAAPKPSNTADKKPQGPAKPKEDPKKDDKKPDIKKPATDAKKPDPANKRPSSTSTKNDATPPTKKSRRNPLPTKYSVPASAGIAGVGGGSLPDPGFVLEPADIYQKAENGGSSVMAVWTTTGMAILFTFAVTLLY